MELLAGDELRPAYDLINTQVTHGSAKCHPPLLRLMQDLVATVVNMAGKRDVTGRLKEGLCIGTPQSPATTTIAGIVCLACTPACSELFTATCAHRAGGAARVPVAAAVRGPAELERLRQHVRVGAPAIGGRSQPTGTGRGLGFGGRLGSGFQIIVGRL